VARLIGPGLFLVGLRHELYRTSQQVYRKTDVSWRDPIGGLQYEAGALASLPGWTPIEDIAEHILGAQRREAALVGFIESGGLLRQLAGRSAIAVRRLSAPWLRAYWLSWPGRARPTFAAARS